MKIFLFSILLALSPYVLAEKYNAQIYHDDFLMLKIYSEKEDKYTVTKITKKEFLEIYELNKEAIQKHFGKHITARLSEIQLNEPIPTGVLNLNQHIALFLNNIQFVGNIDKECSTLEKTSYVGPRDPDVTPGRIPRILLPPWADPPRGDFNDIFSEDDNTPTPTPTPRRTPIPVTTRTPIPVNTPSRTPIPVTTRTPIPVNTPSRTPIPVATKTPIPVATPTLYPPVPTLPPSFDP